MAGPTWSRIPARLIAARNMLATSAVTSARSVGSKYRVQLVGVAWANSRRPSTSRSSRVLVVQLPVRVQAERERAGDVAARPVAQRQDHRNVRPRVTQRGRLGHRTERGVDPADHLGLPVGEHLAAAGGLGGRVVGERRAGKSSDHVHEASIEEEVPNPRPKRRCRQAHAHAAEPGSRQHGPRSSRLAAGVAVGGALNSPMQPRPYADLAP